MKVFICECKYTYIIGRKNVYGPLWEDKISASLGRLMTRKQWEEEYPEIKMRLFEKISVCRS